MRDSKDRPRRPCESGPGSESRRPGPAAAPIPAWLEGLDELSPPPRARERVLAAMREASRSGQASRRRRPPRWRAAAVAGLAAVVLGAAWFAWSGPAGRDSAPGDAPVRAGPVLLSPDEAATRAGLLEASQRLETVLARLPAQRRLMRADTATTIAVLETQIAAIDERLLIGTAAGLEPETEQLLWRERVDALNALVQVRYGQSRLFEF